MHLIMEFVVILVNTSYSYSLKDLFHDEIILVLYLHSL